MDAELSQVIDKMIERGLINWKSTLCGLALAVLQELTAIKQAHGADTLTMALVITTTLAGILARD